MFTDPQSVTIDGTPVSLPRVAMNGRSGVYESADGAYTLTISHANNKGRIRSLVRLDHKKVGTDPLNTALNRQYNASVYMVVDMPAVGFSDEELEDDMTGLTALIGGSGWKARFLGQES